MRSSFLVLVSSLVLVTGLVGCRPGDDSMRGGPPGASASAEGKPSGGEGRSGRPGGRRGGPPGGAGGGGEAETAVPVEVLTVERRSISATFESHGTLEAENEVDLVARTSGPILELNVEAGDRVREGQLLALLDQDERRAQMEIARVELEEAERTWKRTEKLAESALVSPEEADKARAQLDSAQAQLHGQEITFGYTEIRAPFTGLVVRRYVKFAEHVNVGAPLFRLSDFDPLLCPIQVPERELPRLEIGQPATVRVEAYPGEGFAARVLRISPVIDAGSGTVEVTLEVEADGKLRPGMFARVDLELENRPDVLVVPKTALALDGLGDAVYVANGDAASRREIRVGAREGDVLEVLEGIEEGEVVVVVGQDGLADGTPIRVLGGGSDVDAEREGRPGRSKSRRTGEGS